MTTTATLPGLPLELILAILDHLAAISTVPHEVLATTALDWTALKNPIRQRSDLIAVLGPIARTCSALLFVCRAQVRDHRHAHVRLSVGMSPRSASSEEIVPGSFESPDSSFFLAESSPWEYQFVPGTCAAEYTRDAIVPEGQDGVDWPPRPRSLALYLHLTAPYGAPPMPPPTDDDLDELPTSPTSPLGESRLSAAPVARPDPPLRLSSVVPVLTPLGHNLSALLLGFPATLPAAALTALPAVLRPLLEPSGQGPPQLHSLTIRLAPDSKPAVQTMALTAACAFLSGGSVRRLAVSMVATEVGVGWGGTDVAHALVTGTAAVPKGLRSITHLELTWPAVARAAVRKLLGATGAEHVAIRVAHWTAAANADQPPENATVLPVRDLRILTQPRSASPSVLHLASLQHLEHLMVVMNRVPMRAIGVDENVGDDAFLGAISRDTWSLPRAVTLMWPASAPSSSTRLSCVGGFGGPPAAYATATLAQLRNSSSDEAEGIQELALSRLPELSYLQLPPAPCLVLHLGDSVREAPALVASARIARCVWILDDPVWGHRRSSLINNNNHALVDDFLGGSGSSTATPPWFVDLLLDNPRLSRLVVVSFAGGAHCGISAWVGGARHQGTTHGGWIYEPQKKIGKAMYTVRYGAGWPSRWITASDPHDKEQNDQPWRLPWAVLALNLAERGTRTGWSVVIERLPLPI
ncbi:hypothetical protein BC828DRAFT_381779 [Blastocladiella britannica]|nr:hypothetical protein BC828DRAFT_381779 [Blastocladiella britannica]